ncbi:PA3496 family putative envelope integrity protein [Marinobacterium stanieri]|uniref:Uncharacterized protein n=1 Tax=Marinobacterium stanieri TaxID=49186 RepID=A0A1N6PYH2_9GAMM|nr:hypothetical protein [Marinobacterium stanieri]SIQ09391.1 hypothetical protein SAMN05421647_102122 [Marinobacterium stanieri]
MGTKIRVDQVNDDELDDWTDQMNDEDDLNRSRVKYNSKRRRQIEDLMEDRRLMRQIANVYDDLEHLRDL